MKTTANPEFRSPAGPSSEARAHSASGSKPPARAAAAIHEVPRTPSSSLGISLTSRIGNTPLLRFDSLASGLPHVQILGKAEWANPGGSVKDRAALNIIDTAIREGRLPPGRRLLDSTSGNTGIAYAMIGAARNIPVTLCVPSNVSVERKRILHAYGAEVIWTDPLEGSDGAIRTARQLAAAQPEKYYYVDQYSSDANWLAHYHGTANEIWEQTRGRITHFVAGLGTSGTFVGCVRRLRELAAQRGDLEHKLTAISVQPDSPFHGLEGLKHMPTAIVPRIFDPSLADLNLEIGTEEAHEMVKRLARTEGVLIGVSSGAALAAAVRVARDLGPSAEDGDTSGPAVIVAILPDAADRYLSENFW